MSWTVPSGCYYGMYYLNPSGPSSWFYYSAGSTVPTEKSPNNSAVRPYNYVLIDFNNGYIYTGLTGKTITINSNNTFTVTPVDGTIGGYSSLSIIASNDCANSFNLTLAGSAFTFGNGSGMLNKSSVLPSSTKYMMRKTFSGRSITSVTIPTGVSDLYGAFENCTSLVTAPIIPSGVTNTYHCFYGCTSLSGTATINGSPSNYTDMFTGTVNEIILLGSGGSNEAIASQYANIYAWSLVSMITAQRDANASTTVNVSVDVTRFKVGTLTSLSLYKNAGQTPLSVTWNDPTLTITGNPTTFTTTITGIAESDTPTISVIAKDAYGSAKKVSVNVPIAFYTMDVQAGGKEIAFGAIATDNLTNHPNGLFRCNMDTLLNGPLECNNNVKFNNAINPITVSNGLPPYYKITSTQIDLTESAPVSDTLHDQTIRHYDANGTRIGQIEVYRTTADVMGTAIQVARTVGGELVHNTIAIRIDANGNMGYTVGSPSAFRSAIGITRGTTTAITTPAGSYTDYNVTFGKTYSSNPTVIVGFVSSSTAGAFGRCSCSVNSITTTGCTVRVFNGDTTQRAPNVSWVAVGD